MKKFDASFESLRQFKCPEWFADAKLGIWSHWGPQSVPMCGDWYARNMYIEGSEQYNYHLRHYGHPSEFGYKDIVKLWKAEKFDPDELMEKYYKAGARYFVGQAMHHDHFFNYPSKLHSFNSMQIGPMKDICGMWKSAADNCKLPFGLTEHLGATFWWWAVNKDSDKFGNYAGVPYDGNDKEYSELYLDNYEHVGNDEWKWYTDNKEWHEYWLSVMKELIDLYEPDFLYSDGTLPFGSYTKESPEEAFTCGLTAVAYLYNKSIDKYGENRAIYTQKNRSPNVYKVGILDIEKSQLPGIQTDIWQTDSCIGNWFYDAKQPYKRPAHVIEMLIDIISKNGVLLLNILQRPDGTIDDEASWILDEMATWYAICGDAIYGSKPWRVYGEGASSVLIDGFTEKAVTWTDSDYRFVTKGDKLYAFVMEAPKNKVCTIKSLNNGENVKNVRLLGKGDVAWSYESGILSVKLPSTLPTDYTNCLEIEIENLK